MCPHTHTHTSSNTNTVGNAYQSLGTCEKTKRMEGKRRIAKYDLKYENRAGVNTFVNLLLKGLPVQ